MPPTIRRARLDDLPIIVDFNCRLAHETESKVLDVRIVERGVAALLKDEQKGIYYVAEEPSNGELIGQLQITREWSDWRDGWFWWLQSVYVREDARSKGVFTALFESMRADALRSGDVVGIRLYVEASNTRAHAVYRRLGLAFGGYQVMELQINDGKPD